MTLIEALVVIAVISVLAYVLLPIHVPGPEKSAVVVCMSNLKQIGLAEIMWADDNKSDFSALISTNSHGTREYLTNGRIDLHYQALASYLPSAKVFRCPVDERQPATNFADLKITNLSYFASLDASCSNVASVLAGDRNLTLNGIARPGLAILTTTGTVGWTKGLHYLATRQRRGNLLFPDGHAESAREDGLATLTGQLGTNVNRLVFP